MSHLDDPLNGRRRLVGGDAQLTPRPPTRTSSAAEDPRWDDFLARRDAHHTQTTAWARVKHVDGWQPLRITVEDGEVIVAGAQLLYRRVPAFGNVAYLSRGPVTRPDDPDATDRLFDALAQATSTARIRAVLIEPATDATAAVGRLARRRMVPAHQRLSLGATVLLDIGRDPEDILAGMRSKTRYNVRRAQRKGITVRRADAHELPTFHRLLLQTGKRQGFEVAAESRYRRWFEVLGAEGYLQLFIAEYEGEPVSAMLAIAFGDTVVYKRGAWSGRHGDLRPNEALHWAVMQWGHHAGYRWYDFDGIDRAAADPVVRGQPVPERYLNSVTRFKLGFGGEVVLLPESLVHLHRAPARQLYSLFGPRLASSKRIRRALAVSH